MLTLILILVGVGLFLVGVFWPRKSREVQHATDKHVRPIERWAERLRQPFKFILKSPFWTSRKVTDFSSRKGRQARKKIKK